MTNSTTRDKFEAWIARDPDVPAGLRWDSPIILSYERCYLAARRAALLEVAKRLDDLFYYSASAVVRALAAEEMKP